MPPAFLALSAAVLRVLSLPGAVWPPLAIAAVFARAWGFSVRTPLWIEYGAGVLFWAAAFLFLRFMHPIVPVIAGLVYGTTWLAEALIFRGLGFGRPKTVQPVWAVVPRAFLSLAAVEYFRSLVPVFASAWAGWGSSWAGLIPPGMGSFLGEAGLSILVLLCGCLAFELFSRRRAWIAIPLAAVMLAGLFVRIEPPTEPAETVRCLAVQPAQDLSPGPARSEAAARFARLERLLSSKANEAPALQLIIMPETAWPWGAVAADAAGIIRVLRPGRPPASTAAAELRRIQTEYVRQILSGYGGFPLLLTGAQVLDAADSPDSVSSRTNQAILFSTQGKVLWRGGKHRLVPLAEALPLPANLPQARALADWIYETVGYHPSYTSALNSPLLSAPGLTAGIGSAICWDNVFEDVFREQANAGAVAFVVLSSDSGLGEVQEPAHVMASSRWRAMETGRSLLRVSNAGPTALFLPDGRIAKALPPREAGALMVDLPLAAPKGRTPYCEWGWLLLPLCGFAALAILGVRLMLVATPIFFRRRIG